MSAQSFLDNPLNSSIASLMQPTLQQPPLPSSLGYDISWSEDWTEIERSRVRLRRIQIVSWRQRMVVQRAFNRSGYMTHGNISIDMGSDMRVVMPRFCHSRPIHLPMVNNPSTTNTMIPTFFGDRPVDKQYSRGQNCRRTRHRDV